MASDELLGEGDGRVVRLEREYEATPAEVWSAWTDPDRLARWLGRLAGPLAADRTRMRFGDEPDQWADLTVLELQEPSRLTLLWSFPGASDSVLEVAIAPLGDGRTRVVVEHRGLGAMDTGYGAGWSAYLAALAAELGGRDDGRSWDERFATALPAWRARAS
jgi:uncharacterized protein YndB with AHSA1/START domain